VPAAGDGEMRSEHGARYHGRSGRDSEGERGVGWPARMARGRDDVPVGGLAMASTVVNTAVVGCGIFGEVHAATYAEFAQSRLVAVCDQDAGRARRMADRFGCRFYTRAEDLAADAEVQAVSVVTPDFAHRDVCVALAQAGKHLLVEKPLATSVADARAIVAAVRAAGVIGMVDFHNRFHPALLAVKERLDRGEIGSPQMLYARLSDRMEVATQWFSWSGKSGPEWFLGSHLVDVAAGSFGAAPVRVYAEGRKDVLAGQGIDCYDAMQIHLSFPRGFCHAGDLVDLAQGLADDLRLFREPADHPGAGGCGHGPPGRERWWMRRGMTARCYLAARRWGRRRLGSLPIRSGHLLRSVLAGAVQSMSVRGGAQECGGAGGGPDFGADGAGGGGGGVTRLWLAGAARQNLFSRVFCQSHERAGRVGEVILRPPG